MTQRLFSIAAVAELTGLTKEVLRKWEDRYGFPAPKRDASGIRQFNDEHVARLQLIKSLLDRGIRAGRVVPLTFEALSAMAASFRPASCLDMGDEAAVYLIEALRSDDPNMVRVFLDDALRQEGLWKFVTCRVPVLNDLVTASMGMQRISVGSARLYFDLLQTTLSKQVARIPTSHVGPRILLTTPAGDLSQLELTCMHAVLAMERADCVSLGPNLEITEIVAAALQYRSNIVSLSVADHFSPKTLRDVTLRLRALLPAGVSLWIGGSGAGAFQECLPGIAVLPHLNGVSDVLRDFR